MSKINKISPEVMKAGQDNKLKTKDINFTDKLIKNNFNASKTYKETINQNTTDLTARVEASKKLTNPNIQKTIIEVLKDNKITKNSTIIRHNNIIDKAYKINQLSTAEKGNSRFMEMLGMLEKKAEISNNITNITQININKLNKNEVNNKLLDIIKG